ncbi:neuronal acetylcholine receptor subunit beta-4-like [Patella vulgata]|uniref:neuronal acetylcholine receptor subunit beta-4-like n=1 Tax=Patella vulgata TaxID=6465 RepID=UPI00217F326D|nr:neuronal acetylcholine receptor subunit beta-4-like [Patella vulgata]
MLIWKDDLLVWNKTDYEEIEHIAIPAKRVWVPDLYIDNSISIESGILTPGDYILSVDNNGTVIWYLGKTTETRCKMNLGKFPFDTQTCSIDLIQWASKASEVRLLKSDNIGPILFEPSGTWKLENSLTTEKFLYGNTQIQITLQISLSRYPLFYVLTTILPICLLAILNPVVFLVPAESGEKISLPVSILLAYSVTLSALSELLPEVSENISILGVYVCTMLCLKVVSVVASVGAVSLYHRSGSVPREGVYHWLGKTGRRGIKTNNVHVVGGNTDEEIISWQDVSRACDRIMFYLMCSVALLISIVCASFIF